MYQTVNGDTFGLLTLFRETRPPNPLSSPPFFSYERKKPGGGNTLPPPLSFFSSLDTFPHKRGMIGPARRRANKVRDEGD